MPPDPDVVRVVAGDGRYRHSDFAPLGLPATGRLAGGAKPLPGRIVVGIDARDGRVAVTGWSETSSVRAMDLALKFEQSGVAAIVFARRFIGRGERRWAAYTIATAAAGTVLGIAATPAGDFRLMFAGAALSWIWAAAVAAKLRREARTPAAA